MSVSESVPYALIDPPTIWFVDRPVASGGRIAFCFA